MDLGPYIVLIPSRTIPQPLFTLSPSQSLFAFSFMSEDSWDSLDSGLVPTSLLTDQLSSTSTVFLTVTSTDQSTFTPAESSTSTSTPMGSATATSIDNTLSGSENGGSHRGVWMSDIMIIAIAAAGAVLCIVAAVFALLYFRSRRRERIRRETPAELKESFLAKDSACTPKRIRNRPANMSFANSENGTSRGPRPSTMRHADSAGFGGSRASLSPTPSSVFIIPLSPASEMPTLGYVSSQQVPTPAHERFSAIPSEIFTVVDHISPTRPPSMSQMPPPPLPSQSPTPRPLPNPPQRNLSSRRLQRLTGSEWSELTIPPPPYASPPYHHPNGKDEPPSSPGSECTTLSPSGLSPPSLQRPSESPKSPLVSSPETERAQSSQPPSTSALRPLRVRRLPSGTSAGSEPSPPSSFRFPFPPPPPLQPPQSNTL